MIFSDLIFELICVLEKTEITDEVLDEVFSLLASNYHIGRIDIDFFVGKTIYTPEGIKRQGTWEYAKEDINQEKYEKVIHTEEGGLLTFSVYSMENAAKWTDEEKKQMESVLCIISYHMGRQRLGGMVKKSAMTEYMTGLPNSGGFLEYARTLFENNTLKKYNAYYFNLKGFGLVNKKFGQKEADDIIKRYVKVLIDFTDADECIGRLGGDNFVALIRKERTDSFLQLINGVHTYGIKDGQEVPVVIASVAGVCEIDDTLTNHGQVISQCAVALNVAKNIVKKPYMFVTKEMNERVLREKQIADKFSGAIKNNEFVVYYQPKVDVDSYKIVGAEALVRWFSDGKMISPGEFIPVIERDASVCRLDFYMLEQVCQDIKQWIEKGMEPVRISVNFSRRHLSNPNLAEQVMCILHKYDVDSKYIEIEVTETTDEDEQGRLNRFMTKMREYGVTTSIDDFGTGYSSLNILRSFPVDVLKIDKSFIDNGIRTDNDRIVLTNIVKMAKQLSMDVVTEGVESWAQVNYLCAIDCNIVQGFLFDKPMPKEDFEERIRAKKYDIEKVTDYC